MIKREIGDRRGEGTTLMNLGLAYEKQGDLPRAAELMDVYVRFLREIGHAHVEKRAAQVAELRARMG